MPAKPQAKKDRYFLPMALASILLSGLVLSSCTAHSSPATAPLPSHEVAVSTPPSSAETLQPTAEILQQSWLAYRQRFIQADGRVIDWEDEGRTVSEGQAYALLRAVLIDDSETFSLVLGWAENNLRQQIEGAQPSQLWAWKWGQDAQGNWKALDPNFASDADVDAITALILAARRWNRPDYLELAQAKLQDLWTLSTVAVPGRSGTAGDRYLLPGPAIAFQPSPTLLKLNPSYLSPAAFRLFAQVDSHHNWSSLVESSYHVLESTKLSAVGLPSDWVMLNTNTRAFQPLPASEPQGSVYGFDAYRVWWRITLDAVWFDEPRATEFLQQHLGHLRELWRSQQSIPARIDLQGHALVDYEATAQYAMLYAAFRLTDPTLAEQIRQQKLNTQYNNGIWDNNSAYYVQNLAWFGLFPPTEVPSNLLSNSVE